MFLLLFIVVPGVELFLLIMVGKNIGVWPTIGTVIFTGALGWALMKHQGISIMRKIQIEMNQGRIPAVEMVSGLCLLGTGLLLITPGFITDTVGFLLLVPQLRSRLATVIMVKIRDKVQRVEVYPPGP